MLRTALILVAAVALAVVAGAGFYFWKQHQAPRMLPFDPEIVSISRENGVDPFLTRALIWRESKFDPMTLGTSGERGLMQVMPDAGREWARAHKMDDYKDDDLYDPATNIRAGTWYLSRAIRRWSDTDDPVTFALAEYNAGRSNALKWVDPVDPHDHNAFLDRITFPSTRKYVEVILQRRDLYRQELARDPLYCDATGGSVTASP